MRFNSPGRFNRSAFNTDRVFTFPALEATVENAVSDTFLSPGPLPFPAPLTSWAYRKKLTLNNTGGDLTNYQIKFTVYRSAGADSGYDVYVGTDCQEDYDDLRFTTSDGSTLLDYWIETSDIATATVWVEFDSITGTSTTDFYLYYGYAAATAGSDGDATFSFFDGFDGSSIDPVKWTVTGTPTISSGILQFRVNNQAIYSSATFARPCILEARYNSYAALNNYNWLFLTNADNSQKVGFYWGSPYFDSVSSHGGNYADCGGTYTGWQRLTYVWTASNVNNYMDGVLRGGTRTTVAGPLAIQVRVTPGNASSDLDWVFIRECAASVPTVSVWGAVETDAGTGLFPDSLFKFVLTETTTVKNTPELTYSLEIPPITTTVKNTPELTHAIQINLDGVWELGFTAGSSEFQVGETVTGDTSGATGTVIAVDVTSGSWAGSDAAGTILIEDVEGVFEDGEDLNGSVSGDDATEADGSQERITPKVVSKAVWKGINDVYWTAHVDLYGLYAYTANANYRELLVSMVDHLGASNEIFNGFVPLQGLVQNPGENITSLTAFSHSWYLANQYVPDAWRGTAIWNTYGATGYLTFYEPSVIVTGLLGGALYNLVTGIRPTYINTVTDWGTSDRPERGFAWRPSASKWDAIQEICDYLGYAFDVIWNPTNRRQDGSFCDIADIDTYMGIPAAVTFAHDASPGYVLNVHKEKRGTEQINRVRVQGRRNKRILHFVTGTTEFTAADTVVDGGTGATATIISCTLTAGAWDGTGVGYLIISYDRTGDYLDGNTIISTLGAGWGEAVMQGNSVPYELYDEYPYYIESAEVSNEDGDRPRERFFELEDEWDSTPLIQAKCQEYYDLFSLDASNYTVTWRDRCDLRLWQKVKLIGFSDIPEDWMRIVHIRYEERDAGNVIVTAVLNNADYVMSQRKMRRSLKPDDVSAIEAMIQAILDKNLKVDDATVLKVDGEYYSVELVDGQITFIAKGTE